MAGHFKWVVDPAHPQGHAVPLTAEEEALYDADQASGAVSAAAAAAANANAATLRAAVTGRMTQLRNARTAIAAGNLFAGLSTNEKAVIDGLLEDDLYLARLVLGLYDGTA